MPNITISGPPRTVATQQALKASTYPAFMRHLPPVPANAAKKRNSRAPIVAVPETGWTRGL